MIDHALRRRGASMRYRASFGPALLVARPTGCGAGLRSAAEKHHVDGRRNFGEGARGRQAPPRRGGKTARRGDPTFGAEGDGRAGLRNGFGSAAAPNNRPI